MVQINDDYYEDLTPENFAKLLDDLAPAGRSTRARRPGACRSEPAGGLTSLTTLYGVDGKSGPASRAGQSVKTGTDERCLRTRTASSPISTASATAA